jgi:hypothetical protein
MAYLTDYQYYNNEGNQPQDANWGSYQYISLEDIVNNFVLMYVGNDKLVNNAERYNVLFHAKRAIQELNYDAMKETKIVELTVTDRLNVVLPEDFVNWVRISLYKDGVLRPLSENFQTNYATAYLQDNDGFVLFDHEGNVLKGTSVIEEDRVNGQNVKIYPGERDLERTNIYQYTIGGRFGVETETHNGNPTFKLDKRSGVINFSSEMADENVILEYVSDGLEKGNDSAVSINKMFEEYIYAYIKYAILNAKFGVQEYIVNRARKERTNLLRNAKIRLSNIHPGRLLMPMRGQDKWIK